MDVLWGAWVRQVVFDEQHRTTDILGIYDEIWKRRKSDFPFSVNLNVILSYQAYPSEYEKTKEVSFSMHDIDASELFSYSFMLQVPALYGDSKIRWYESYDLSNIVIKEPGYYELGILVNGEEKQNIPLRVIAPKMVDLDKLINHDIYEERWIEDKDIET